MRPVMTVFFDGLKPESLQHMPFLNSFEHKRHLQTLLGYSITCHASMYSGVHPDKHLMWFVWQREPESSPFRWLRYAPFLRYADSLPTRLLLHKVTTRFKKRTAFWGIPRIVNLPVRYWPNFDVSEKRFWEEPGYLDGYPTIFDLLRANRVPYEVTGWPDRRVPSWQQVDAHRFAEVKPWTYFFIGEVDGLSHSYLQDSPLVIEKLREFDAIIERRYRELEARVGEFDFFAFSDHGHQKVNEKVNLYQHFKLAGDNLNAYMHLVDVNYARFWFRNDAERRRVESILGQLGKGFILSQSDMECHHVRMPDNRFGDLIYYLDAPAAFSWTTFGFGKKQWSQHGYLPANPNCDGVFVANRPIAQDGPIQLVDILPSLLGLLGLDIPDHVDGKAVWG